MRLWEYYGSPWVTMSFRCIRSARVFPSFSTGERIVTSCASAASAQEIHVATCKTSSFVKKSTARTFEESSIAPIVIVAACRV
jgi:hypothetical protein